MDSTRTKVSGLLMVVAFFLAPLVAQDNDDRRKYEAFSLEELFKLDVVTASKQKEPIYDAPGVVTVMTAIEIEQFGALSLFELLNRIPGVTSTRFSSIDRVSVRGGEPHIVSPFHTLVLIDGRPLRTSAGNFSTYNPFKTFPVSMIERIEVVRGPGSVLYGTNAMEGVINIITKKAESNELQFEISNGQDNTRGASFSTAYVTNDFELNAGAYFLDTEGWDAQFNAINFLGDETRVHDQPWQDHMGANLDMRYKNFHFSGFFGNFKELSQIFYDDSFAELSFNSKVSLLNVKYNLDLSNDWELELQATHNREKGEFIWGGDIALGPAITEDTLIEVTAFGNIGKANFIIGGLIQDLSGNAEGATFGNDFKHSVDIYNAYTQLNYRHNRYFKGIAGFQINKPEDTAADIVPRIGGIFSFTPNTGMKLLYGRAFRSPTELEKNIDTPTVQLGNPDLDSEHIDTFDLQYFLKGTNYEAVISAYKSKEKNLVRSIPTPEYSIGITVNEGELNLQGIELETKYAINKWYLLGSITYQENENEIGEKDVTRIPTISASVSLSYKSGPFRAGVVNVYDDGYHSTNLPENLILNPSTSSTNLITANLSVNLGQWIDGETKVLFEFYGRNLLDEDIWVPEYLTNTFNTVPADGGRTFYGTLKIRY